ncbi:hypothetical protein MIND_00734800 [Mycena indigotica]|uniref:Uncharacterized protein n=1 Tax=Mycena indigotica TaxID=2126181 RepID=A0A8H6SL94_9AGAR|nr:uncharacterized protein MIND_00734800 [Mycena indigotica]KAF7301693.1 hypothetical protein MIND_00734800 [Mycena indigotica]
MTVRFAIHRIALYGSCFVVAAYVSLLDRSVQVPSSRMPSIGTVLGLSAHFANIFLPHLHAAFTIFALLIPSLTIFTMLISLQFAQPQTEAPMLFLLWALWLAMAAWDIISGVQCDSLTSETMPTKNGLIRQREYCYEMKANFVIQAFSWMAFVLLTFAFCILISLINQAQRFGRITIWSDPIQGAVSFERINLKIDHYPELGWFGEPPGYYNTTHGPSQYAMYPQQQYPQQYGYPLQPGYIQGPQPVYQISQGPAGTTVTQVPVLNV